MRISRGAILIILGSLSICFLGASYALWFDFNPSTLPAVISGSPTPITAATAGTTNQNNNGLWLTVNDSGIARISARNLRSNGLNFNQLSADELRFTLEGQDIPFFVNGEGDNAIAYFLAQQNDNPEEALHVYHIQPGVGKVMATKNGEPLNQGRSTVKQKFVWEEDRIFVEKAQGGDPWMGQLLLAPDTWTYSLGPIDPYAGSATLSLELFSKVDDESKPDHHVELLVNDKTISHNTWDGIRHKTISASFDATILLQDKENTVTLVVHDDSNIVGETIYINSLSLEFMGDIQTNDGPVSFSSGTATINIPKGGDNLLVFDVTSPTEPAYLSNLEDDNGDTIFNVQGEDRDYIALNSSDAIRPTVQAIPKWQNSLYDVGWGADYIAIVADVIGFENALEPLLAYRQEQGLRVVAIPLLQIYHEFGFGQKNPKAIKEFLAFAAENWVKPAPKFVLLVGDATFDVKDQISGKNRNRLPAALIPTSNGEFVVSDSWFVQFDGQTPRMAIGRLPAQTAPQLHSMVEKTLSYEASETLSDDSAWKKRALLIADDEPEFDESLKNTANFLSEHGYHVYRLPMSQQENIRSNILRALNQGVGLVNYIGYGNQFAWGDEAVFRNSDAQALNNSTRLPILTAFSSRNGAFAEPQTDSLVETLLRSNSGGVAAAIAFSGKTVGDQHVAIAESFFENLILKEKTTLGEAFQEFYTEGVDNVGLQDTITSLNLLGDPGLNFSPPSSD